MNANVEVGAEIQLGTAHAVFGYCRPKLEYQYDICGLDRANNVETTNIDILCTTKSGCHDRIDIK